MIREIQSFYQIHKESRVEEIDRRFFLEIALLAPWTIVRCEITEQEKQKKFSAFKVRAPKKIEDINNYENYLYEKRKLTPILIEDERVFRIWQHQAIQKTGHPNLEEYKNFSMIDAVDRGN